MGTFSADSNDRFPEAAFGYDPVDANLVDPPIAYGADITTAGTAMTCPRPVFAGGDWVGETIKVWHVDTWDTQTVAAKVSDYAVTLTGALPLGDATDENWYAALASGDSSVGNVAKRYQSLPDPLPCTIIEGKAYIDAAALGDLTAAPYHVPA